MNFHFMISHLVFVNLGWALVQLVWQGILIAAVLKITLLLVDARDARIRYALCCVALAAIPGCFLVTFWQLSHELPAPLSTKSAVRADWVLAPGATSAVMAKDTTSAVPAPAELAGRSVSTWDWNGFMPPIAFVWLAGVVLLSGRKAGGMVLLWRWRRHGIFDPDEEMINLLHRTCRKIGVDPRRVSLKISELVRVPMTMGWWRPVVLLPSCLISGLSTVEIEMLLTHELAHIRRWDYLVNLLQAVVETLFFHHPLTWWISHRMRQERENCCDDLVVRTTGGKLAYAQVLLRLEESRAAGSPFILAATGGLLRKRIERLLVEPMPGMAGSFSILLTLLFLGAVASLPFARAQTASVSKAASAVVVTETKELVGDVGRLYHAIVYTQTSAEAPKLGPTSYQFIADMSNNAFPITGGSVSLPAKSAWATNPVAVVKPDLLVGAHYLYVQGFQSEADLLANFPYGPYAFNIRPGAAGAPAYVAPVPFTGAVPYPPIAPAITNKTWNSGFLVLDPTSAEITFTNYPGATLTWEIVIPGRTYVMSAGGGGTSAGVLNLTGLLSYGQTYDAQLRFINRDKSSTVSDPSSPKDYGYSTMMAQIVEFKIKTLPQHPVASQAGTTSTGMDATKHNYIRVAMKVIQISENDYQAHRATIDAAVKRGDIGPLTALASFDLLSEPTLLVKSGEKGTLEAVREMPFATRYQKNSSGKLNPTDFETRDIGVRLPLSVTSSGGKIELNGQLQISSFQGWTKSNDQTMSPTIDTVDAYFFTELNSGETKGIQAAGTQVVPDHSTGIKIPGSEIPGRLARLFLFIDARSG